MHPAFPDRSPRELAPGERDAIASLPAGWEPRTDLIVLVGSGAGPLSRWLVEGGQERIVVFDPEARADASTDEALPESVFVLRDLAELTGALLRMPGAQPSSMSVISLDHARHDAERHAAVGRAAQEAVRARGREARTLAEFGARWTEHQLRNLPAIAAHPSVAALRGRFAGRPAVLVSPGPSLSRNLHLLPELTDRALLIAGTHVLRALDRAGAFPQVVVAGDAGDLLRHLEGIDPTRIEALLAAATCQPELLRLPARRCFPFSGSAVDRWIFDAAGEDATLPSGGSVACTQLSLAYALGCDPILFVGQDLAFTGGRYYANETVDGDARLHTAQDGGFYLEKPSGGEGVGRRRADGALRMTVTRPSVEVPGHDGGTVTTSTVLRFFLHWIERRLVTDDTGTRVVNCTEGGARIHGAEHRPLASMLAELPDEPIHARRVFERAARDAASPERRARLQALIARLAHHATAALAALDECQRLAVGATRDRAAIERLVRHDQALEVELEALGTLGWFHVPLDPRHARTDDPLVQRRAHYRAFERVLRPACADLSAALQEQTPPLT